MKNNNLEYGMRIYGYTDFLKKPGVKKNKKNKRSLVMKIIFITVATIMILRGFIGI